MLSFIWLKKPNKSSTSIEYKSSNGEKATLISYHNADHAIILLILL